MNQQVLMERLNEALDCLGDVVEGIDAGGAIEPAEVSARVAAVAAARAVEAAIMAVRNIGL